MKYGRGQVSTLGDGATVSSFEEDGYTTGGLRVPAWMRDEERYPDEVVRVGDAVVYAEAIDGGGIVIGKV